MHFSESALREVLRCKKAEIEKKRLETLGELDAQIEAFQAALGNEGCPHQFAIKSELMKLIDVRADASQRFGDAMHDLARQEKSWFLKGAIGINSKQI